MNSVQTVTLNSELSQNWVGCTVRTPRTQVAPPLRSQCPCRGRCCAHSKLVARMSRAQPTQVTRSACVGRVHSAQVVGACRDLSLLRPSPGQVATSWRLNHVATSNWCCDTTQATPCRDLKKGSRHRFSCPAPSQVATSSFQVVTSWSFTYVTTSFPCRDLVPAHSGTFRSRHRNPCRDLPHCRPCRDIKSTSRRRFRPTKADQVATPLPGRDLTPNQT